MKENEMELARKIMHIAYMFRLEKGVGIQKKDLFMSHRDAMVLYTIMRLNPKEGMVRMNELCHYFGITPAAVSQMMKNFEKKGWIERIHLDYDRRSVYIKVSDKAIYHMRDCEKRITESLGAFLSSLGEEDAQALVRILEKGLVFAKEQQDSSKREKGEHTC